MPHPKRRTWALGTLDQAVVYRLWFDPDEYRWECVPVGTRAEWLEDGPATTQGGGVPRRPEAEGTPRPRRAGVTSGSRLRAAGAVTRQR